MFSNSETYKNHSPTVSREEREEAQLCREHDQLHPPLHTKKKKSLGSCAVCSSAVDGIPTSAFQEQKGTYFSTFSLFRWHKKQGSPKPGLKHC